MNTPPEQITLDLSPPSIQSFESFLINNANEQAVKWLQNPSLWPMPILGLTAGPGSGKSHLASAFARKHKGRLLKPNVSIRVSQCRGEVIALDDARKWSEESLFILLNMALHDDIPYLLITDRNPPSGWGVKLPDLRSRLNNIPLVTLSLPDETLVEPIIRKLFADQGREISKPVVDYMLIHCSRDISELERDVANIERAAREKKADVTKRFVAKILRQ